MKKTPYAFAHGMQGKVQFPKMASRTATSIVLLTVLLTGTVTPSGVCAFMCKRHAQTESQRHCSQRSDSMSGMAHDHSAMNHPGVEAMKAVLASQACHSNCVESERLTVWKKLVPQVTVVELGAVALNTTAKFVTPDFAAAWSSDSGPPPSAVYAAPFRILRI